MRVLFICIGNSCRSQIAEGWAKNLGIDACSAGTHPANSIATNAIIVMSEIGIDISEGKPKSMDEFNEDDFELIISMGCGVQCPKLPIADDWGLKDPVGGTLQTYRLTRDIIESKIRKLVD